MSEAKANNIEAEVNPYKESLPITLWAMLIEHRHQEDTILPNVIHGYEDAAYNGKYKILKGWWGGLTPLLHFAKNIIKDKQFKEEMKLFNKTYLSKNFKRQELVTEDDIREANRIIDLALGKLEATYQLQVPVGDSDEIKQARIGKAEKILEKRFPQNVAKT